MNRRGFLKFFGIGTVVTAVSPTVIANAQIMASRMPSPKRMGASGEHCTLRPNLATGAAFTPGECSHIATVAGWKVMGRGPGPNA